MANQKAQQISIPFEAPLNMNKNVTDVKSCIGFNERNSPIFGGCLSPLFFKTDTSGANTVYDRSGNKYTLSNGVLYKNGTQLMTVNTTGYSKETVTNISTVSSITVNPINVIAFKFNSAGVLAYATSNGNVITCHCQYNGAEYTTTINSAAEVIFGVGIHFDGDNAFVIAATANAADTAYYNIEAVNFTISTQTWASYTLPGGTAIIKTTPCDTLDSTLVNSTFTRWPTTFNAVMSGDFTAKFNF